MVVSLGIVAPEGSGAARPPSTSTSRSPTSTRTRRSPSRPAPSRSTSCSRKLGGLGLGGLGGATGGAGGSSSGGGTCGSGSNAEAREVLEVRHRRRQRRGQGAQVRRAADRPVGSRSKRIATRRRHGRGDAQHLDRRAAARPVGRLAGGAGVRHLDARRSSSSRGHRRRGARSCCSSSACSRPRTPRASGRAPSRAARRAWLKPMSGARTRGKGAVAPPLTAADYVVVGVVVLAVAAFEAWFFFFAGSSLELRSPRMRLIVCYGTWDAGGHPLRPRPHGARERRPRPAGRAAPTAGASCPTRSTSCPAARRRSAGPARSTCRC